MSAPSWVGVVLVMAAVGGGLLAFRQQSKIEILRGEAGALDAARSSRTVSRQPEVPSNSPPPGGDRLSEAEKLDLLRLRGEVTRLRAQVRGLAGVRVENDKLKASLQPTAHTDRPSGLPAGYQRRRDAQFVGYGSPEATIQSLLWATEHRDTNALLAAFDTEMSEGMRETLANVDGETFWQALRVVPGWRIMSDGQRGPDQAFLKVEFMPGEPPQDIRLQLVGNEWKIRNNVEPPPLTESPRDPGVPELRRMNSP